MKKFYLIAAMAVATLAASAQEKLTLSTYNGTNIAKFDGKVCNVSVNRYVFTGWNTISLPFAVSEQELNEVFGSDCKLEKLVGADNEGNSIKLYFQNCKAEGMQANTPYILYYTGESSTKKIAKDALVTEEAAALSFTTKHGETVTMTGVKAKTEGKGLYGVLARDNADAKFVKVDDIANNGFFATRCYIQLSTGNQTPLVTAHLNAGETTGIAAVAAGNEVVDVYNTAGVKVASQISVADVNKLRPNIYVVNGQKILVK